MKLYNNNNNMSKISNNNSMINNIRQSRLKCSKYIKNIYIQ